MEYKIYVGELLKLSKGFLQGSFKVMYCGMSNENTFVLSPLITEGYQGFSPNIFYNFNATVIQVYNREFDVLEVTPDYIVLGV